MQVLILDTGAPENCRPITCTRPLSACPVANRPLIDRQKERLAAAGFEWVETAPQNAPFLKIAGDSWVSVETLRKLKSVSNLPVVLTDARGDALAFLGGPGHEPARARKIPSDENSFRIRYAWDLLRVNEILCGEIAEDKIEGETSDRATIEGRLVLGKGSRILPGVCIRGAVIIGRDCTIGPNCFIRDNTAIGDHCRVGHAVEIKNSILMNGVGMSHLSYCGDSIVGEGVNFGAGTITANVRHDSAPHRSMIAGELVETGRLKLGAIIGDGVHTGIHTSIYPGRKIWPGLSTRPGEIVRRDLETFS